MRGEFSQVQQYLIPGQGRNSAEPSASDWCRSSRPDSVQLDYWVQHWVSRAEFFLYSCCSQLVRYGKMGSTPEEIEEATKSAQMHDRIMSFPDGRGLRKFLLAFLN